VYAHFDCFLGANEENANSRLVIKPFETFEVMTCDVFIIYDDLTDEGDIRGGSDAVLITENVSLHLNAKSLTIAPNRHICGKTVLWWFFVLHPHPASMYCCAF
jgi:hypothetical protein